jgi:hypothetical protein
MSCERVRSCKSRDTHVTGSDSSSICHVIGENISRSSTGWPSGDRLGARMPVRRQSDRPFPPGWRWRPRSTTIQMRRFISQDRHTSIIQRCRPIRVEDSMPMRAIRTPIPRRRTSAPDAGIRDAAVPAARWRHEQPACTRYMIAASTALSSARRSPPPCRRGAGIGIKRLCRFPEVVGCPGTNHDLGHER